MPSPDPVPPAADQPAPLDAEYRREWAAGLRPVGPSLVSDPATDPFGQGYAWLTTPLPPFETAHDRFADLSTADRIAAAGPSLRAAVLAGAMASGTDEEVIRRWARDNFVAFCRSAGADGAELLDRITTTGDASEGTVREVTAVLQDHPRAARLTLDQQVALALVVIDTLAPPPSQPG